MRFKAIVEKITGIRLYLVAAIAISLTVGTVAFAVHSTLFELGDNVPSPGSGNIKDDVPFMPDWAELFDSNGDPTDGNNNGIPDFKEVFGGLAATFVADQLSVKGLTDDTIFVNSNKNNHLIPTWNWDTGNVPPKDDIANAYAYADLNGSEELIVYAGIERLTPKGASHVDFEFNQSEVAPDKTVPCDDDLSDGAEDGSPCEFLGEKTEGDVLVVMDFEQGGALGLVEVRSWDPILGYVLKAVLAKDPNTGSAEGCNEAYNGVPADAICAVNNGDDIDGGPWPNYDRHGAVIEMLPENAFTEVGINVTAILGFTPCLNTLQVKTRSSPAFNSELKDFALSGFNICGSITVIKDAIADPVDGQDFDYFTTGLEPVNFSLDDDGDETLPDTIVFEDLPQGDYTVTEDGPAAGWALTDLTCVDPTDDTVTDENTGLAEIDLAFGEDVTCTYTNTKLGTLIIRKETDPEGFSPAEFGFTFSGDEELPIALSDQEEEVIENLLPTTYEVLESSLPDGWDLIAIECDDVGSSGDVGSLTASYDLTGGKTVKCTFTNRARGKISIYKDAIPDDPFSFDYSTTSGTDTVLGNFSLDDDGVGDNWILFDEVIPGSYSVTEAVPGGWDLTGLFCTDPTDDSGRVDETSTVDINVGPGEHVQCFYENTKRAKITIVKNAIPDDAQSFGYTTTSGTATTIGNFSIVDSSGGAGGTGTTFSNLIPGAYSVTESGPPLGWEFTDLFCEDSTGGTTWEGQIASIGLDPGEEVTCTFTNTKQGRILIDKVTVPTLSPDLFEFDPSYSGNFLLTDASAPNDSGYLSPNAVYTVSELEPAGWILKTISCDDANSTTAIPTATVHLDIGEVVTCTFTNIVPTEGCTPGFWKNHLEDWPEGFHPGDLFVTHFGVLLPGAGDPNTLTLEQALNLGGGDVFAVTRHAAAALLNSAALEGTYRIDQIIAMYAAVNDGTLSISEALAIFSSANELGCPLN